jgi:hypothetical protein
MLPIFLIVAIIGGCVGIFFLRAKRRPQLRLCPRSRSRASRRIAHPKAGTKLSALTEEAKACRTGIPNREARGAKANQLDQIKKFKAADTAKLEKFVASKIN